MQTFTLHFRGFTEPKIISGPDLFIACLRSNIGVGRLKRLERFETGGISTDVMCKANCGCVHHAEDELSCEHDLERVGIISTKIPM
jgi:hypothetical protein